MRIDELVQLHILQLKAMDHTTGNAAKVLDQLLENVEEPVLRQMCAKVTPVLYDRLTRITDCLNLTKRQFIEWTIREAIERAEDSYVKGYGVLPPLPPQHPQALQESQDTEGGE